MSTSTNLYQISSAAFNSLKQNPESQQLEFNEENSSVFDQNFEGLHFLFSQYYNDNLPVELDLLFNPALSIGEEPDYANLDFDNMDEFPESAAIYYITPEDIKTITTTLQSIDTTRLLHAYNAAVFNKNGVYPEVWHDNENPDEAFNKTHLSQGISQLQETLAKAEKNNNYILYFSG